jgi:transposase
MVQWDRDGFAMFNKKLERDTFERPRINGNAINDR